MTVPRPANLQKLGAARGWRLALACLTATACGGHTLETVVEPNHTSAGGAAELPVSGGAAPVTIVDTTSLENLGKPWQSHGCGLDLPAQQVQTIPWTRTGYTEWRVEQTGASLGSVDASKAGPRQFFVRVPPDYDANKPYRVVYLGQGCGSQHAAKADTYPLFNEGEGGTEQAIYVAVSLPDNGGNPGCYDTNAGPQSQEWEAFDLVHTFVESHYCVDNNRIFVAGSGSGGWLANMWGCYFGGIPSPPLDLPDAAAGLTQRKFSPRWAIRGDASVRGAKPDNQPMPCNGPAAHFYLHDTVPGGEEFDSEVAALNLALQSNGCSGNYKDGPKQPWAPAEQIPNLAGGVCQEYTGCPAEVAQRYPLVFCATTGAGNYDQTNSAIPALTRFFDLMDPTP